MDAKSLIREIGQIRVRGATGIRLKRASGSAILSAGCDYFRPIFDPHLS
jgi:hypothetical protein